jgi:hypothetical protein
MKNNSGSQAINLVITESLEVGELFSHLKYLLSPNLALNSSCFIKYKKYKITIKTRWKE